MTILLPLFAVPGLDEEPDSEHMHGCCAQLQTPVPS